jgi:hypothetical protein
MKKQLANPLIDLPKLPTQKTALSFTKRQKGLQNRNRKQRGERRKT